MNDEGQKRDHLPRVRLRIRMGQPIQAHPLYGRRCWIHVDCPTTTRQPTAMLRQLGYEWHDGLLVKRLLKHLVLTTKEPAM